MSMDVFGDLREWNRVIAQLEELNAAGQLDEHQDGLARLLRYRFNWRIREKAVRSLAKLTAPEDRILLLALEIAADEHTAFDMRTLAAVTLRGLVEARQKRDGLNEDLTARIVTALGAAVNAHQPPDFQCAAQQTIERAREGAPSLARPAGVG